MGNLYAQKEAGLDLRGRPANVPTPDLGPVPFPTALPSLSVARAGTRTLPCPRQWLCEQAQVASLLGSLRGLQRQRPHHPKARSCVLGPVTEPPGTGHACRCLVMLAAP